MHHDEQALLDRARPMLSGQIERALNDGHDLAALAGIIIEPEADWLMAKVSPARRPPPGYPFVAVMPVDRLLSFVADHIAPERAAVLQRGIAESRARDRFLVGLAMRDYFHVQTLERLAFTGRGGRA